MFKLSKTATESASGLKAANHSSAAIHPTTERDTSGKAAGFRPNELGPLACAAQVPRRQTAT